MELQDFHSLLEGINSIHINEAENAYNELLENDPASLLQLIVTSIVTFNDKTVRCAIVLLGRTAKKLDQEFINIGNEDFHTSFQASLLSLIESHIAEPDLVPLLSNAIAAFAFVYQSPRWPDLCISLLQYIYQPEIGIITPPTDSPLSSFLATDILWQCINNESIILNQEDVILYILTIIEKIFQEPAAVQSHQLVSTIKLTSSLCMINPQLPQIEQIMHFSNPIVELIPQLPQEIIDDYIGAISLISDNNILFFREPIQAFISTLIDLINDFQQVSDITRIRSINILKQIISNEQMVSSIEEFQPFQVYQLFLSVIGNSTFELDPELGLQKSCTMTITEDAINSLSNYFSNEGEFAINVATLLAECMNDDFNYNYVVANLIGYASCVKDDSAQIYYCALLGEQNLTILPVFQATLSNEDPKLRVIAIESLNSIMKNFGEFEKEFWGKDIIPLLAETISKENDEIIMTYLIKSLKIFVTHFYDFAPFCDDLMELLGSHFDQMNEQQQILTLTCYKEISDYLGEKFLQYMEPIYQFIENLFGSYNAEDHNFPIDLFFVCMKLAPQFTCLPQDNFNSISQTILTFISTIGDFSQLSKKQMDSVNGAICSILERNGSQFIPYANEIVSSIFIMAMKDIECRTIPFDSNSDQEYKYGEDVTIFNRKTNMYDIYSKNSIDSVCEAMNSLKSLLQFIDEIVKMENFLGNIIQVIFKNFQNISISENIRIKVIYLVTYLFRSVKKNNMMEAIFTPQNDDENHRPIAFQFYTLQLAATIEVFNVINDIQSFEESELYVKRLEKSFLFICKAFSKLQNDENNFFQEFLNQTILFIISVNQKIIDMSANALRIQEYSDGLQEVNYIESYIGSFFGIIFTYMTPLLSPELISSFCNNVFVLQPQKVSWDEKMRVSLISLDFWLYFLLLHPDCSGQQASQILEILRNLIQEGQLTSDSLENCMSIMMRIVVGFAEKTEENAEERSNRFGYGDFIEVTLQFLSEFFENSDHSILSIISKVINKELIIIAFKMVQVQQDPSLPLQLLINLMPIFINLSDFSFDDYYDDDESISRLLTEFNERAADCLLFLVQNDQIEILQTDEGVATAVVMASLIHHTLRNKIESIRKNDLNKNDPVLLPFEQSADNLANFVASVTNGSQLIENIAELYKETNFYKDVLKEIRYAVSCKKD